MIKYIWICQNDLRPLPKKVIVQEKIVLQCCSVAVPK